MRGYHDAIRDGQLGNRIADAQRDALKNVLAGMSWMWTLTHGKACRLSGPWMEPRSPLVGVGPFFLSARTEITAMAARLKLPAMYSWREFVDAGGLMSYGSNLPDLYRTAARLVDRILKGAKPGDLPFEIPTRYELIVNLKTAKAMGLNISDSFLLLADEIIE
jgi:ABC transporter substrate binding protein